MFFHDFIMIFVC